MERIRLLDVLRGLAIIGTFGVNIWFFGLNNDLKSPESSSDDFVQTFFMFLFNGKFLGMLTILFGAGIELNRQKKLAANQKWLGLYIWSSALLFVDGLLHYLFVFQADILMSYALTAMIVAVILEKGDKVAKWIGWMMGTLHGAVVILISLVFAILLRMGEMQDIMKRVFQRMSQEMSELFLYGGYWEQVIYRISHFFELRMEAITILPFNISLFLIGAWLVRNGYFAQTGDGRLKRMKLLKWGLGLGLPLNAIVFTPLADFIIIADRYLFAPILSLGYIGFISYLLAKFNDSFVMHALEKVGKVALSCYIMQNVIASILFYGWGFGLGFYSNTWIILAAWLLISTLLIVLSFIWLRFFKQGPFEYIWRSSANFKFK